MKIKVTTVHVDDQERALRFYTGVLGFVKKNDFSQGPYRWLTVASAEEPNGTELQLALNNNPAAQTYQQALFQQGQPAAMFFTDNLQADYERNFKQYEHLPQPKVTAVEATIKKSAAAIASAGTQRLFQLGRSRLPMLRSMFRRNSGAG